MQRDYSTRNRELQVDESSTRLRLCSVPPLGPFTCRLHAYCSTASTYFWQSF